MLCYAIPYHTILVRNCYLLTTKYKLPITNYQLITTNYSVLLTNIDRRVSWKSEGSARSQYA